MEARVREIHHYITQYPPDIYVDVLFPRLGWPDTSDTCPNTTTRREVKGKAYVDRALSNVWIELKNEQIEGTISTDKLRRLQYACHHNIALRTNCNEPSDISHEDRAST
jgi:hypothetical protein